MAQKKKVNINGILIDPKTIKGVTSMEEIQALGLFDHFNATAKQNSENLLAIELGIETEEKEDPAAQ